MDIKLSAKEEAIARKIARDDEISGWIGATMAVLFLVGLAILGWQCLQWLRLGEWTSRTWSDAAAWTGLSPLDLPGSRGVEKILRFVGSFPLCLLPPAMAFGLFFATERKDTPEIRSVRSKLAQRRLQGAVERMKNN